MGGLGTCVAPATTPLSDAMEKFAWRWTRITNHKRDTADPGTAFMIFVNDVSQPVPANGGKPLLETLEAIEKKQGAAVSLYGHSITRGSGGGGPKVTITPDAAQVVFIPQVVDRGEDESFSVATLGEWLPSHDYEKAEGYVRPVFEVTCSRPPPGSAAPTGPLVKPVNVQGRCPLYLFTNKK